MWTGRNAKQRLVHNDGLDALSEGLAKDGLGLDTNSIDAVDDDEGTVSDTEGGRDLGREIDVTGRVDQVDEEVSTCAGLVSEILRVRGRQKSGNAPSCFCLMSGTSSSGSEKNMVIAVDLMVIPRSCSS